MGLPQNMTPLSDPISELMMAAMYWLRWPVEPGDRPALTGRLVNAGKQGLAADLPAAYRPLADAAANAATLSHTATAAAIEAAWEPAAVHARRAAAHRLCGTGATDRGRPANQNAATGADLSSRPTATGAKVSRDSLTADDPRVKAWRDRADLV